MFQEISIDTSVDQVLAMCASFLCHYSPSSHSFIEYRSLIDHCIVSAWDFMCVEMSDS